MPRSAVQQCVTCHSDFTVFVKRVGQTGRWLYCKPACRPRVGLRGKANPAYKHGDSGNAGRYTRPYKLAHPEIAAAHQVVALALKRGMLTKPETCERCSQARRLDAHHDDYAKPLVVRWLCRKCHNDLHMAKRAA